MLTVKLFDCIVVAMALYVPEEITLTCQDGIKLAGRRWIRQSDGISNKSNKELRFLCWVRFVLLL
jgi:hypothetical protein